MDYKVNPEAYRSVFAVPCSVVDQHIKLAGSAQIKVLLWLLRNNGNSFTIEDISKALGLANGDATDAFQYWVENGLVVTSEISPEKTFSALSPQKQPAGEALPANTYMKKRTAQIQHKPTREEVAQRGAESAEIAFMLNEAQVKLGRLLNQSEASSLVWLHDHEGLPVAIILMVIEYALTQEKRSFSYIEKTALNWAEQGINTIEKAEKQILQILSTKKAWRLLESVFGLEQRRPSEKEKKYAFKWVDEWGFSKTVLHAAYEECVNNTSKLSLPYINKILEKWHNAGIKNAKDLQAYMKMEKESVNKKSNAKSAASYNIEELENMILNDSFGVKG